jgi:hypothetical protein
VGINSARRRTEREKIESDSPERLFSRNEKQVLLLEVDL